MKKLSVSLIMALSIAFSISVSADVRNIQLNVEMMTTAEELNVFVETFESYAVSQGASLESAQSIRSSVKSLIASGLPESGSYSRNHITATSEKDLSKKILIIGLSYNRAFLNDSITAKYSMIRTVSMLKAIIKM